MNLAELVNAHILSMALASRVECIATPEASPCGELPSIQLNGLSNPAPISYRLSLPYLIVAVPAPLTGSPDNIVHSRNGVAAFRREAGTELLYVLARSCSHTR